MALQAFRRDFVATDKHYVTNYGITCVGILIVVIVLGFIITGFITTNQSAQIVLLIGALIVFVFLIKTSLNRRNEGMLNDDIE